MNDGATTRQLQRDAQVAGDPDGAHAAHIESRLKDLHTSTPGIIVSFDKDTQTATVQPAIKRIFTEDGAVNLPVCVDVPVSFPGGGDFFLTFPIKPGDECILLFSERAIDFWHVNGGTQLPAEYRLHDLSDAIAIVGLNSQPKKLADVQTDGAELRTRDRSTYIRLTAGTIYIKGNIEHDGDTQQQGSTTQTGNITLTGSATVSATVTAQMVVGQSDVTSGGVSGKNHAHGNVRSGPDTSGPPQ